MYQNTHKSFMHTIYLFIHSQTSRRLFIDLLFGTHTYTYTLITYTVIQPHHSLTVFPFMPQVFSQPFSIHPACSFERNPIANTCARAWLEYIQRNEVQINCFKVTTISICYGSIFSWKILGACALRSSFVNFYYCFSKQIESELRCEFRLC